MTDERFSCRTTGARLTSTPRRRRSMPADGADRGEPAPRFAGASESRAHPAFALAEKT